MYSYSLDMSDSKYFWQDEASIERVDKEEDIGKLSWKVGQSQQTLKFLTSKLIII